MRTLVAMILASVAATTVSAQVLSFSDQSVAAKYKPKYTFPGCKPDVLNRPSQSSSIAEVQLGENRYKLSYIVLVGTHHDCERRGCDIFVIDGDPNAKKPDIILQTHGSHIELGPMVNGRLVITVDMVQYWWSGKEAISETYICQ